MGTRTDWFWDGVILLTYTGTFMLPEYGPGFPAVIAAESEMFMLLSELAGLSVALTVRGVLFKAGKRRAEEQLVEAKEKAEGIEYSFQSL